MYKPKPLACFQVKHDKHPLFEMTLARQGHRKAPYKIEITDIDPLSRSFYETQDGVKTIWRLMADNIYEIALQEEVNTVNAVSLVLPATLAVTYDHCVREVFGKHCSECPRYDLAMPNKTYHYY